MKKYIIFLSIIVFNMNFLTHYCYGENKTTVSQTDMKLPTIPENIKAILENNVSEIDPISFVWKEQRSSQMDIDTFCNRFKLGPGMYNYFYPIHNIYIWQDNKAFMYSNQYNVTVGTNSIKIDKNGKALTTPHKAEIKIQRSYMEVSMDGQNYYGGKKVGDDQIPTELSVFSLDKIMETDKNYPLFFQSYLSHIGFKYPVYGSELKAKPVSYPLFLADSGEIQSSKTISINGKDVLQIVIKSGIPLIDINNGVHLFSLYLIPEMNYALKQIEVSTIDGSLLYSVINDQFEKLSRTGVHIPRKTEVKYYAFGNEVIDRSSEPLYTQLYSLAEVSLKKINTAQFDLRNTFTQSGTMVTDRTLRDSGEGLTFFVPANPADLDRVIEAALTGGSFVPTPLPSTGAIIVRWLLIIAGIAMILYACYMKFVKKSNE